MITAGDFKNGLTFEMEGKVYQVIEFQHVKPGKGAAFVRTKYRDVVTGATREASFNPTAKFENAVIERRDLEYLYCDGELYYFMDPESYEQIPLNADKLGDNFKFVKENTTCRICSGLSGSLILKLIISASTFFSGSARKTGLKETSKGSAS